MLSGHFPFKANNMEDLHSLITAGKFVEVPDISEEARDLINKCLTVNPRKRITLSEVLDHPWLINPSVIAQSAFLIS